MVASVLCFGGIRMLRCHCLFLLEDRLDTEYLLEKVGVIQENSLFQCDVI